MLYFRQHKPCFKEGETIYIKIKKAIPVIETITFRDDKKPINT
jgi:hypothetical protein